MEIYDTVIIGGGPAGLTAALYTARKELRTVIVSNDIGGQILLTNKIENYPGLPSVSGFELADKMENQVKQYPVEFITAGIRSVEIQKDGIFLLHRDDDKNLLAKTCIVTSGKHSRQLGIPGESEFTGRGVSYCATCDGPFYRNKVTAIVGGGDSAVQSALELARISSQVYLLVRSRIRASEIVARKLAEYQNIKVLRGVSPVRIKGEEKISAVVIRDKNGTEKELAIDGLFVEIGGIPNNSFLPDSLKKNELGEIITDKEGKTSIPGFFAAGDVTDSRDKQIIIAAGEGAAAALSAHEYLLRKEK